MPVRGYSNTDGDYAVAKYRYGRGQNIFVATWNKLYRTEFLRKNEVRCIPHYLIDDPWFTYQVILRARSCRLLPDCTLFFTYNPQSVTSVKERQGYSEFLAEQYIGTQLLKSGYIHSLTGEPFYNGLMLDILKMSLIMPTGYMLLHVFRRRRSGNIWKIFYPAIFSIRHIGIWIKI